MSFLSITMLLTICSSCVVGSFWMRFFLHCQHFLSTFGLFRPSKYLSRNFIQSRYPYSVLKEICRVCNLPLISLWATLELQNVFFYQSFLISRCINHIYLPLNLWYGYRALLRNDRSGRDDKWEWFLIFPHSLYYFDSWAQLMNE